MTHRKHPDLERVSWIEAFALRHKRGIRKVFEYAVIAFFVLLAYLLFASTAAAEPQIASLPTPAPVVRPSPSHALRRSASGLSEAQEAVKAQILAIAEEEGYQAPLFLSRLAMCESGLNPLAKNKHSSALGLFQILDSHGLTVEQRTDVDFATRWTIDQLMEGHASWWVCTDIIS